MFTCFLIIWYKTIFKNNFDIVKKKYPKMPGSLIYTCTFERLKSALY